MITTEKNCTKNLLRKAKKLIHDYTDANCSNQF